VAVDRCAQAQATDLDLLLPQDLATEDEPQRQLDDRGDLAVLRHHLRPLDERSDERAQLEVRDRDPDVVEGADQPDGLRLHPDLLVGFTQCRSLA
jgi:hypothetical protein